VVDDNADGRQLLHTPLAPLGFRLHEARDGVEGLERIVALQPDLVLLDWRMERLAAELPAVSPDLALRLRAMLERTEFRQLWELL
jgi:CheY-like chemotaxis protein